MRRIPSIGITLCGLLLACSFVVAQEQKTASAQEQGKPPALTPSAKLAAARTAYLKRVGGNEIAYNVIETSMEGWGRFLLADSPEKADIIIDVSGPSEDGDVSVSSRTRTNGVSGRPEQSTTTSRDLSNAPVKLVVFDAKTKMLLWSGTENPKGGFKQKTRDDNLVQAANKLFTRFHDRVEPPLAH